MRMRVFPDAPPSGAWLTNLQRSASRLGDRDMNARYEIGGLTRGAGEAARAALAYAALGLGLAGTIAVVPLIALGLAARGFH